MMAQVAEARVVVTDAEEGEKGEHYQSALRGAIEERFLWQ
jgi:hypothetical protein